jgi:hypothetical protein
VIYRAERRTEKYADALGVPLMHGMFDLLTFAVACHIVTRRFQPDDDHPLNAKKTSLQRLARELDVPIESARASLGG